MNNYYILALFVDNADGEAYLYLKDTVETLETAFKYALNYLNYFDHVCILTSEHENLLKDNVKYTQILPYAVSLNIGAECNINKL